MNRVALVTGGSRGIGSATAAALAREGFAVAVNYCSNEQSARSCVEDIINAGGRAQAFWADVSDRAQVAAMIKDVHQTLGRVEVLVNNAGIARQQLFTDITDGDWDRMFAVNVTGAFHCIQEVLPDMLSVKNGAIINLSSIWGITGASCEVHYSAAKAAIIGLTKALAKELGPSGIRVNCVAPGVIHTDMNSDLDGDTLAALCDETPLGVIGSPEDAANAVVFLASKKARFITGQVLSPNGGFVI